MPTTMHKSNGSLQLLRPLFTSLTEAYRNVASHLASFLSNPHEPVPELLKECALVCQATGFLAGQRFTEACVSIACDLRQQPSSEGFRLLAAGVNAIGVHTRGLSDGTGASYNALNITYRRLLREWVSSGEDASKTDMLFMPMFRTIDNDEQWTAPAESSEAAFVAYLNEHLLDAESFDRDQLGRFFRSLEARNSSRAVKVYLDSAMCILEMDEIPEVCLESIGVILQGLADNGFNGIDVTHASRLLFHISKSELNSARARRLMQSILLEQDSTVADAELAKKFAAALDKVRDILKTSAGSNTTDRLGGAAKQLNAGSEKLGSPVVTQLSAALSSACHQDPAARAAAGSETFWFNCALSVVIMRQAVDMAARGIGEDELMDITADVERRLGDLSIPLTAPLLQPPMMEKQSRTTAIAALCKEALKEIVGIKELIESAIQRLDNGVPAGEAAEGYGHKLIDSLGTIEGALETIGSHKAAALARIALEKANAFSSWTSPSSLMLVTDIVSTLGLGFERLNGSSKADLDELIIHEISSIAPSIVESDAHDALDGGHVETNGAPQTSVTLTDIFVEEATAQIDDVSIRLPEFTNDDMGWAQLVVQLFHSLRGGARVAGLTQISILADQGEDALIAWIEAPQPQRVDPEVVHCAAIRVVPLLRSLLHEETNPQRSPELLAELTSQVRSTFIDIISNPGVGASDDIGLLDADESVVDAFPHAVIAAADVSVDADEFSADGGEFIAADDEPAIPPDVRGLDHVPTETNIGTDLLHAATPDPVSWLQDGHDLVAQPDDTLLDVPGTDDSDFVEGEVSQDEADPEVALDRAQSDTSFACEGQVDPDPDMWPEGSIGPSVTDGHSGREAPINIDLGARYEAAGFSDDASVSLTTAELVSEPSADATDSDLFSELASSDEVGLFGEDPIESNAGADLSDSIEALRASIAVAFANEVDSIEKLCDQSLADVLSAEVDSLIPSMSVASQAWVSGQGHPETIVDLRRTIHTLKGCVRIGGMMRVGSALHAMEDLLDAHEGSESHLLGNAALAAVFQEALELCASSTLETLDRARMGLIMQAGSHSNASQEEAEASLSYEVTGPESTDGQEAAQATAATPLQAEREELKLGTAATFATPGVTHAPAASTHAAPELMMRVSVSSVENISRDSGQASALQARTEEEFAMAARSVTELDEHIDRARRLLKELEIQAEIRIQAGRSAEVGGAFDPIEFDRFTQLQEVSRGLAESINDISACGKELSRQVERLKDTETLRTGVNTRIQEHASKLLLSSLGAYRARLERVIALACSDTGKKASLLLADDAQAPGPVLDRLLPSIEHILRNSIAHGIEAPAVRAAKNKPQVGTVSISVQNTGARVSIIVSDDGSGIDTQRVLERAVTKGLARGDRALSEQQIFSLLFKPGFSTAESVSQLAGRGVGLDVVQHTVTEVGGSVSIASAVGNGTSFTLSVPSDISNMAVLPVTVGGANFLIPANLVDRLTSLPGTAASNVINLDGHEGGSCPVIDLARMVGVSRTKGAHGKAAGKVSTTLVVMGTESGSPIAFKVDQVRQQVRILAQPLSPLISSLPGIVAGTVDGTGAACLVINPLRMNDLGEDAVQTTPTASLVMLVDDSSTVRMTTSQALRRDGFEVITAKDGIDAIEQLQRGVHPDAFIFDLEMPRMDGFELTKTVRSMAMFEHSPIFVVSSRTSTKHRETVMGLGATEFLGKPVQTSELAALIHAIKQTTKSATV